MPVTLSPLSVDALGLDQQTRDGLVDRVGPTIDDLPEAQAAHYYLENVKGIGDEYTSRLTRTILAGVKMNNIETSYRSIDVKSYDGIYHYSTGRYGQQISREDLLTGKVSSFRWSQDFKIDSLASFFGNVYAIVDSNWTSDDPKYPPTHMRALAKIKMDGDSLKIIQEDLNNRAPDKFAVDASEKHEIRQLGITFYNCLAPSINGCFVGLHNFWRNEGCVMLEADCKGTATAFCY